MASYLTTDLSEFRSTCAAVHFVEKNLSSKNGVEKDRTMLSKVHFTSVEISFGKNLLIFLKKRFSAGGQKLFPRVLGSICEKFIQKILVYSDCWVKKFAWSYQNGFPQLQRKVFGIEMFWKTCKIIENWAVTEWAGAISFVFHVCWEKFYGITCD